MKVVVVLFLLFSGNLFSQDSLISLSNPIIREELSGYKAGMDTKLFLDSLIIAKRTDNNGKKYFNPYLAFTKIVVLEENAAFLMAFRGDFEASKRYLESAYTHIDTLLMLRPEPKEDIDALSFNIFLNRRNYCNYFYFKDTTAFNQWNCRPLFPELDTVSCQTDTVQTVIRIPEKIKEKPSKPIGFYDRNALQIDTKLISDSLSVAYFENNKGQILEQLKEQISKFQSMELEQEMNPGRDNTDTIIVEVEINIGDGAYSRSCRLVKFPADKFMSSIVLQAFIQMQFRYLPNENVRFYVPIVLQPEADIYYNGIHRFVIRKDHYLVQYETLRPIRPH